MLQKLKCTNVEINFSYEKHHVMSPRKDQEMLNLKWKPELVILQIYETGQLLNYILSSSTKKLYLQFTASNEV